MENYKESKFVEFLLVLPMWFTFSGLFLYENSAKNMLFLFALSCITSIFFYGYKHIFPQLKRNPMIWILFSLAGYGVIQDFLHGFSNGMIKTYFALGLYMSIVPSKKLSNIKNQLPILSYIASISALTFYLYQTYILHNTRDNWDIGSLQYTVLLVWIACLNIITFIESKNTSIKILSTIAIGINLYIIIASQGRGIYLTLLISSFIICLFYIIKKPKFFLIATPLLAFFITLACFNSSKIEQRLEQTKDEYLLIKSGNLDSSIGLRLQMWKAALYMEPKNLILGLGNKHKEMKEELEKDGVISKEAASYKHYHNDFINTLVKNGIVGLLLLISTIIYPSLLYFKDITTINLPILLLPVIFSISSLTNVPFTNLHLITFFFCITWIYKTARQDKLGRKFD